MTSSLHVGGVRAEYGRSPGEGEKMFETVRERGACPRVQKNITNTVPNWPLASNEGMLNPSFHPLIHAHDFLTPFL